MFAFQLTPIVKVLLILNILLFVFEQLIGLPLTNYFALYHINDINFQPIQVATYFFIHDQQSIGHLFSNMLSLFLFGSFVEQQLTSKRFLQLYVFCGIGVGLLITGIQFVEVKQFEYEAVATMENPTPDNVIQFSERFRTTPKLKSLLKAYSKEPNNPVYLAEVKEAIREMAKLGIIGPFTVGASGAIYAIFAFVLLIIPNTRVNLLFIPIPILAKYLVATLAFVELYQLINSRPDDNVSHFGHLAGMLFAFILVKLIWKMKRVN